MTRINASIPPESLCDQHLIAEHREIVRLAHLTTSKSDVTPTFRLGKGHVLFFKDKLKYAHDRYMILYRECLRRGFKVTNMASSFKGISEDFFGDWTPSIGDNEIIAQRLSERLRGMKNIRYFGEIITTDEAINKLNKLNFDILPELKQRGIFTKKINEKIH